MNRSNCSSLSFVEDPITILAYGGDHALKTTSKIDTCPFENEITCSNSPWIDHCLFRYNITFEGDEITLSDLLSRVNLNSSVVFED